MRYFEISYVIIAQTMTVMILDWKSYLVFPLAYIAMDCNYCKGNGQVRVMHVSTETGHFSSELRKMAPKGIQETGLQFTLQL